MGLDIRAYKHIELIDTTDLDTWDEKSYPVNQDGGYHRETFFVYGPNDVGFEEQLDGLVIHGVYGFADTFGFPAGSYWHYNDWRDWLSETMLGVPAHDIWRDADQYHDQPFYYLINFSDCEGKIAGVAAQKLAQDFAEYQAKAEGDLSPDDWRVIRYNNFRKAFEMAADNGAVDFH